MEQRIKNLEQTIQQHNDRINSLSSKINDVNEHLSKIQMTLNQIKWMAIGGIGFFTLSEFGFFAAMRVVT